MTLFLILSRAEVVEVEVCNVRQTSKLVTSKRGKIAKTNISELSNHLTYRGLPYIFEVGSSISYNRYKKSETKSQNSTSNIHHPQGPENLKILSWDNPVSPIDAENSISFFVQFFRGYIRVLGGSVYMNTTLTVLRVQS